MKKDTKPKPAAPAKPAGILNEPPKKKDEKVQSTAEKPGSTRPIRILESRERYLKKTLRALILYVFFLIVVTIFAVGMIVPTKFYLTKAMEALFIRTRFPRASGNQIEFSEVRSPSDFWAYLETALIGGLYWNHWYNASHLAPLEPEDANILSENKLIGVPRIRQLRVRNDSCFQTPEHSCYDWFSSSAEDTSDFGENTEENSTAWTFSTAAETTSITYVGLQGRYHGGGFYQDLTFDRETSRELILNLKKNLWVDRATRCVFVDYTVYNANLNLFCVIKLVFEFSPTGGVVPSSWFQTLKLIRYVKRWDYFVLACEVIFVIFILYYTFEAIIDYAKHRGDYFEKFWTYVDLCILMGAYSCIVIAGVRHFTVENILAEHEVITEVYANFEYPAHLQYIYDSFNAVFTFVAYIKIYKLLNFSRSLGQLNNTLARCAAELLTFGFMFLLIFLAYAHLGYLLFGVQMEGFSSVGIAVITLFRALVGDFQYKELLGANRFLAPIYFLSYVFLVVFVLVNMFLAIINDTYSNVKTEIALAPKELQMSQLIKRPYYNIFRKAPPSRDSVTVPKYDPIFDKIRETLRKFGFTDLHIEMFFLCYKIDNSAEKANLTRLIHDLDKRPPLELEKVTNKAEVLEEDFAIQQERLEVIEATIAEITNKLDSLLKKMETLDHTKKELKKK